MKSGSPRCPCDLGSVRQILHLDLDAFFCAVEELRDPGLVGKPFAVGGHPEGRGVVASCSSPARRFGVHSAMPVSRAVRLCPGLIIVPSMHRAYGEVSKQVMDRLYALTPLVEQVSIDEAFLDVTGAAEPGEHVARGLQKTILSDLRLPCSLGVAANKLVAKIANDAGKAAVRKEGPPNAITVVQPGTEADFLNPLPVKALWGVGPKMAASLNCLGIRTIGDLAGWPERDLTHRFGICGSRLALYARGIDDSPIETDREAKSISKETTFAHDLADRDALFGSLLSLSEGVGKRLRRAGLSCTTISMKMRRPDFTTLTRQVTLREPTDLDRRIFSEARHLLERVWGPGQPVRLLGVGASHLVAPEPQLGLWDAKGEKQQRMQAAIDEVRGKFGDRAVRWGQDKDRDDSGET